MKVAAYAKAMRGEASPECLVARGLPHEAPELLDRQTGVADKSRHRVGVDRVVPRDRNDADPVGHDDVLALTDDAEPGRLEGANRIESDQDFDLAGLFVA